MTQGRRRVVWLAGRRPLLGGSLGEWLIGLRWIAVLGMLATTLVARRFVPGLPLAAILSVLAITASSNVVWIWLLQRRPLHAGSAASTSVIALQIACDVVFLGGVLWLTGGVENPFSIFLTFQVALAALLCGGTTAVAIAALATAVATALSFAPSIPWETAVVPVFQLTRLARLAALVGVATFVGVTAYLSRQRLEAARAVSARNERFAVLGRLMGGMAHELNTPLATIVVASDELVAAGHEAHLDDGGEIERLSTTISQEAKRASNVISLLRGQLRDIQLAEPVDVSRLVREVVPREARTHGYTGELVIEVPSGLSAWGIPAALRQILGTVLKNAIEAMEGRSDPKLVVTATSSGARVVIRVDDNGCGIKPEHLPHLGEPFLTTKASTGGTGLGLYVSSLLAEQMRAVLQIEGAHGGGASVTLSLRSDDDSPMSGDRISHA